MYVGTQTHKGYAALAKFSVRSIADVMCGHARSILLGTRQLIHPTEEADSCLESSVSNCRQLRGHTKNLSQRSTEW